MADAIVRMKFPDLNPHFFAYGQFPLFLAYFTSVILNLFQDLYRFQIKFGMTNIFSVSFSQATFLLRFYSALSQTLLIYIVYLISKKIFPGKNTNYQILYTATITIFLPGLIQAAHFGTTESLLTLFLFLTLYFSLKITDNTAKWFDYLFLILTLGFSLGTKLTALLYFPIPLFALFLSLFLLQHPFPYYILLSRVIQLLRIFTLSLFIVLSSIIISFLVSPYNIWQYQDFLGALRYETDVATGKTLVFYTRQFLNTLPFLFQFTKIFPYTLGWPILILGTTGLILVLINLIKNLFAKSSLLITNYLLLITFSFLIFFIPNAVLFTKWTRFMTPIFPFFAIFSSYFLNVILNLFQDLYSQVKPKMKGVKKFPYYILHTLYSILLLLLIFPGVNFFSQVYLHEDIRFTASRWIYQNIPPGSHILSETGNVVDIPILPPNNSLIHQFTNFPSPVSFDFYHLDEDPELLNQLTTELEKSDYIFIPSRRIFANHMRFADKYPLTAKYYNLLFSQKLGFVKIKEFSRLNDEFAEETWSVFDHPKIRIYKKINILSKEDYKSLIKNYN